MTDATSRVVVAVLTALIAPICVILVKARIMKARRTRGQITCDALVATQELTSALNTLRVDVKADHALILKAENNGGVPSPGSLVFASVVYETFGDQAESVRRSWLRSLLDHQYCELLGELAIGRSLKIGTADLKPGILRDFCISYGIAQTEANAIHARHDGFFYLFLHYGDATKTEGTPKHRDRVRQGLLQMRDIIQRWDDR